MLRCPVFDRAIFVYGDFERPVLCLVKVCLRLDLLQLIDQVSILPFKQDETGIFEIVGVLVLAVVLEKHSCRPSKVTVKPVLCLDQELALRFSMIWIYVQITIRSSRPISSLLANISLNPEIRSATLPTILHYGLILSRVIHSIHPVHHGVVLDEKFIKGILLFSCIPVFIGVLVYFLLHYVHDLQTLFNLGVVSISIKTSSVAQTACVLCGEHLPQLGVLLSR